LNDNNFFLTQTTESSKDTVTVETVFIHKSGKEIKGGKLTVPVAKADPQGFGSALTYARRYSLQAATGIAPEDDDGNAGSGKENPHQWFAEKFTPLLTQLLKAGVYTVEGKEVPFSPERAMYVVSQFLIGKIDKATILTNYSHYKEQL
jgi:hypothetical protein